jgi:NADH-quinone oxidoreductase subunit M
MSGLLKVIPFISVMYIIAGLSSLGLPGFSGFIAEMQIFVGGFLHPDMFHRIATIITVSAIVITAVFILRVAGMMLMGPINNDEFNSLPKATWYERTGILLLLIPIVFMGVTPLWVSDMIRESLQPFLERLM